MQNILITGASSGLGVSLAVMSAKAGLKVYATMRDIDKQEALIAAASDAGVSLNVLQLDVTDTHSIAQCVDTIINNDGKIDVLINNAGAGFVRTTEQATEQDIQWVMDVNFMGVVRCTKAVLPHMRAASAGRIINISSIGGLVGQPFNEIYCAAKFAVEGYTESLACYVGPAFGIHFTAIEPGGISSEFARNVMSHMAATGGILDDPYKPILEKYLGTARARAANPGEPAMYQTPDEVSAIIMDCLHSDVPPVRMRTSEWSNKFCHLKTQADPDGKKLQSEVIESMLGGLPNIISARHQIVSSNSFENFTQSPKAEFKRHKNMPMPAAHATGILYRDVLIFLFDR